MKKIGLISMALVLAMGMLGVGPAWTDTVLAGETVMTGTDFVGIRNVSTDDPIGSLDPVWNGTEIVTSDENVASCISTNNGETKCLNSETEFYDSVTETISNAYPGYAPTMTIEVANCGSLPVTVTGFDKAFTAGNPDLMEHFVELHWWTIHKNGDYVWGHAGEDWLYCFLIGYDDIFPPYQLDPGDVVTLTMNLLILQESPWVPGWEFPQGETVTLQDTFTFTAYDGNGNIIDTDTTMVTIDLVNLVKNPPGWNKGKKSGWDGSVPPGLEKKDKTPDGFDKGNKAGWE